MVLYAPDYWHLPDISPPQRIYFNVPEDAQGAQIFFEGRARLIGPEGALFGEAEGQRGWVDLPSDRPGLWSFDPIDNRLVRARNFPPFFAFGDPEFFFEPEIAWERKEPPAPEPAIPEDTLFVSGAIRVDDDQALRLAGKRSFKLDGGPPDASGDGSRFLPHESGTIEFWFRPDWSTFDLGAGNPRKRVVSITTDKGAWGLLYRVDSEGTNINLGPRDPSHSLYGAMHVEREDGSTARLRVWRTQTLFDRGAWTHIAWSWGPEIVPGPHLEPLKLMTMRIFVNGVGARQVIFRSAVNGLARGAPKSLQIHPLDGAMDELRVSDIQRYTEDFEPSRDRALKADEHTRALFHFDGSLEGVGSGSGTPPKGNVVP